MATSKHPPGPPMDLANMREQGRASEARKQKAPQWAGLSHWKYLDQNVSALLLLTGQPGFPSVQLPIMGPTQPHIFKVSSS
jgi:hypothetical protein